jgi:hypothetical protein
MSATGTKFSESSCSDSLLIFCASGGGGGGGCVGVCARRSTELLSVILSARNIQCSSNSKTPHLLEPPSSGTAEQLRGRMFVLRAACAGTKEGFACEVGRGTRSQIYETNMSVCFAQLQKVGA